MELEHSSMLQVVKAMVVVQIIKIRSFSHNNSNNNNNSNNKNEKVKNISSRLTKNERFLYVYTPIPFHSIQSQTSTSSHHHHTTLHYTTTWLPLDFKLSTYDKRSEEIAIAAIAIAIS